MPTAITAVVARDLTYDDLPRLDEPKASKAPALKRLSDRHHRLARALAEGMERGQAGLICGYVPSRVSILQADPAFQNLVGFYREQVNEVFIDLQERLKDVASTAAAILQDRLEDAPDDFATTELGALVKLGADRTGHGPSSTTTHIAEGMGARLDAASNRLRLHREASDATVIDVALPTLEEDLS
jgi:hypothetical protein